MVKFCLLVCFLLFGVELVLSIAQEKVIYEFDLYISALALNALLLY